jgi:hypothetical protein
MKKYLFIALSFLATAAIGQPLKLNLSKGTKYEVTSTTKVTSSASVMGQTMESIIDNETTENFEVKSVSENNNELDALIKRIKFSMSAMGQETSYNSETSDGKGEIAKEMDGRINKPYQVLYDDKGNILNIDAVKNAQPNAVAQGMAPSSGKVSLIDDDFIGIEFKDGASWNDTTANNDDKMKSLTTGTYKVLTIQNGLASVLFEGTQTQNGIVEQMGMEMNVTGTHTIKKEIMVDVRTGIVMQSKTISTGQNNIEVAGMSIPAEINATITKKVKLVSAQ